MSPYPVQPSPSPLGLSPDLRRNLRQRETVARGIALLGDYGTVVAVEFLKGHAVQAQVIERVLLDPVHRAAA